MSEHLSSLSSLSDSASEIDLFIHKPIAARAPITFAEPNDADVARSLARITKRSVSEIMPEPARVKRQATDPLPHKQSALYVDIDSSARKAERVASVSVSESDSSSDYELPTLTHNPDTALIIEYVF
jgi:hypothetical protein